MRVANFVAAVWSMLTVCWTGGNRVSKHGQDKKLRLVFCSSSAENAGRQFSMWSQKEKFRKHASNLGVNR